MSASKYNVLYVDDEENNLTVFKAAFRRYYNVFTCMSAREGMKILKEHEIHLIVTDQRMPQMTGVQFLEAIIPEYPDVIRMILTGFSDIDSIIKAINTGRVYRYITKPWDENELKITIDRALETYSLQIKNRELVRDLKDKILEQERLLNLFKMYVPEHVVNEALMGQKDDSILLGEYRIISAMFTDIRNSTYLASKMDPKIIVDLLNHYFTVMTECINKHHGCVNKFIGDGILATFGAPVSYIDNQENAVYCALDMISELQEFNKITKEKYKTELIIGIGINTGEVIAGNIGSKERMEYTVIGDTVNVASRIESLTKDTPNGILISQSTYDAVKDLVNVKEWESTYVKGKDEPIKVYEVISRIN